MPTDPSTVTDVKTLIRLRDDYLAEIELAKESISTAESKLSAVTTQLRSIANEARALLATIDLPTPPPPSRSHSTNPTLDALIAHTRTLLPSTDYTYSYFTDTFPSVDYKQLSRLLETCVQRGHLTRTAGYSRGHFTRGAL